ncbi:MAG TPA: hypothetical protein VGJ03_03830 [Acidimicrobiales bacterium]|jgi:hypothetical protein
MRIGRTVLRAALTAAVGLVVLAGPAGADPAKPVDYVSSVTSIQPPNDAISLKVVGGDGFLDLKVKPGHDVVVKGYSGGPWLHIRPDGVVEENQLSPATYLNANRYARVDVPQNVTEQSETTQPPQYKQVGAGGEFAWHDHRIHWMSPDDPPGHTRGDVIFPDWQVGMTVDNAPVTAHGQLVWKHSTTPIGWALIGVAAAGVTLLLGRGKSTFVAAIACLIASVGALETGIVAYRSIPSVAGPNPLEIVLPAAAVLCAIGGLIFHRHPLGVVAILASLASLAGWAIMRYTVLLHPVLPTNLPFWLDRTSTAIALGCAVAAAVLAVRSGALVLRLPELDFGDAEESSNDHSGHSGNDVPRGDRGERSDVS